MAKVRYEEPIDDIRGALVKQGAICRRKRFKRADGGFVEGRAEVYICKNPRDWQATPARAGELANQDLFRQASKRAKEEMENPERAAYWNERFKKQLRKPEKGNTKSYVQTKAFVRAMILKRLKGGE